MFGDDSLVKLITSSAAGGFAVDDVLAVGSRLDLVTFVDSLPAELESEHPGGRTPRCPRSSTPSPAS